MSLNLEQIAIATGGVLVTAAGKKQVKPSLQHHKTFGVKKPKGALPGASAGGWLKKGGKTGIIPDTRNAAAVEKLADKLAPFFDRDGNTWMFTFKNAKAQVSVDNARVYFDVYSHVTNMSFRSVDINKITSKQVAVFARYVQELGSIKLPKVPAFLAK